jgi:16S rRNA G966 N2-methylase RsmD
MEYVELRLPFLEPEKPKSQGALIDKFVIPPFSIFDSRQGYWMSRRAEWMKLGIESEVGRNEELTYRKLDPDKYPNVKSLNEHSTSIFDPVLCEVLLRWFSRPGATVLDPFAGGSVRGIVAGFLERAYIGIELRSEQVEANAKQLETISVPVTPQWIQGDSAEVVPGLEVEADMVFSCPPYADLEVYSDHPADLSNMTYEDFIGTYRAIIRHSCEKLKTDRFAAFVVSEVRNKKNGIYRGFVADTIRAFELAGLGLYNDVVLLNQVGTGAIRAARSMQTRKIVRMHQNVLVFVKGDPKRAANWVREGEQPDQRCA